MFVRLTKKAKRGIGLRSASTKKLTRYEAGDVVEVTDDIAVGLINSGMAIEETIQEETEAKTVQEEAQGDERLRYESMTAKELTRLLSEKGMKTGGTKKDMVDRLLGV